jgi:polyhydroxybutyrate depolymerase
MRSWWIIAADRPSVEGSIPMHASRLLSCILAVALALSLGGCARTTHAKDTTDTAGTITVGGRQRTYLVHLPSGYDPTRPVPLLIALHGSGSTGADMADLTGFNALADTQGFLVAYPDGIDGSWADHNNTDADRAGVDDVAFMDALIDHLSTAYGVDPARVYATGMSNGGFMATLLACTLPETVAAVAPVAATMPLSLVSQCPPGRPVSLLLIHGLDDTVDPPGGGKVDAQGGKIGPIASDAETVAFWASRDGCWSAPAATDLPTTGSGKAKVRQTDYSDCWDGTQVRYDTLTGIGHVWPGGPHSTLQGFDASAVIWSFFAAHPQQREPAVKPWRRISP